MATVEDQLNQLKTSLSSTLGPVLAMAGVANPVSASVLFGIDMVFRFVVLGVQIRQALEQAKKALDKAVRTEGIFRVPIEVDMTFSEVLAFFTRGDCQLVYPIAYDQFKREREIIVDKKHPEWREAFETLALAYRVLPEVYFDFRFDNSPLLDDLFGKWLDPGNPDFRSLIKEMKPFFSAEDISIGDLMRLLPEYSKIKLDLMGAKLDAMTQKAVDDVNRQIHDLVWSAVFGDSGMAKTTTKFAVNTRIEQIDNQLSELKERKNVLQSKPEANRTEAEKKEINQINQRIDDLTKMKERIKSSTGP
jgi:hypothetical protein